jgi:type II secretory pathway pseudopilin PulG
MTAKRPHQPPELGGPACASRRPDRAPARGTTAFTLVELLLVMSMLTVVLALVSPALARFFRGRGLDAEARRLLALTHQGQSRAVAEGIPLVLWLDAKQGRYGLQADPSYYGADTNAVEFELYENLELEVEEGTAASSLYQPTRRLGQPTPAAALVREWEPPASAGSRLWTIRFLPDGTLGRNSPQRIILREDEEHEIWVSQNRSGLRYEIEEQPGEIQPERKPDA